MKREINKINLNLDQQKKLNDEKINKIDENIKKINEKMNKNDENIRKIDEKISIIASQFKKT